MNKNKGEGKVSVVQGILLVNNLISELVNMKRLAKERKQGVVIFSKPLSNIELTTEFFLEYMREKSEPIVLIFEFLKVLLKLREYKLLMNEGVSTYLSPEDIKKLETNIKEQESKILLKRSGKRVPKIKIYPDYNTDSKEIQNVSISATSEDDIALQSNSNWFSWLIYGAVSKLKNGLGDVYGAFTHQNTHMSELIHIIRPLVYVYLITICKKKSNKPILVSFIIDIIIYLLSVTRATDETLSDVEKKELSSRLGIFFKYLLRDPIYHGYFLVVLAKVLKVIRLEGGTMHGLLLSLLGYFKYYAYVA